MGKNKRKQIPYHDDFHNQDLNLDSNEEKDFIDWLVEACNLGIIIDFEYLPESIKLFDSVDYINIEGKKRNLFRDHVYSADFNVTFCPSKHKCLAKEFKLTEQQMLSDEFTVMLDVKGTFNMTERAFSINLKWVYLKTGTYVYKLVPKEFMRKFGCALNCFYTQKTKKARKMYSGCKSISQVFEIMQ